MSKRSTSKRLTADEIRQEVEAIGKLMNQSEEDAHMREDKLYLRVLGAIASGRYPSSAVALARAAITSQRLAFARYYA